MDAVFKCQNTISKIANYFICLNHCSITKCAPNVFCKDLSHSASSFIDYLGAQSSNILYNVSALIIRLNLLSKIAIMLCLLKLICNDCWSFEYLYPIPEKSRNWVPKSTGCPGIPITSQQKNMCLWTAHFFFRIKFVKRI